MEILPEEITAAKEASRLAVDLEKKVAASISRTFIDFKGLLVGLRAHEAIGRGPSDRQEVQRGELAASGRPRSGSRLGGGGRHQRDWQEEGASEIHSKSIENHMKITCPSLEIT